LVARASGAPPLNAQQQRCSRRATMLSATALALVLQLFAAQPARADAADPYGNEDDEVGVEAGCV
jgi:hypothetical protein